MAYMGVVNDEIFPFPTKLDVGVFPLLTGKASSLDGCFLALLLQVCNGGFHETHAIHHPIQILDVIDDGLSGAYSRLHFILFSTRFGEGLVPGR